MLRELADDEVRWIACLLIAGEHPGYRDTLDSLFGDVEPRPSSLARVDTLEERIDRLEELVEHFNGMVDRVLSIHD